MMGTLAGQPVGTAGAIGCLLQPIKGPVASSSEQRKNGWVWRRDPSRSLWTALGSLGTFTPEESSPAQIKAAPGIRLMEQTSLNQQTPSAGSSTSASASAVPSLYADPARAGFVGNIVACVGNYRVFRESGIRPSTDILNPIRHPELVSGSIYPFNSGRVARWTLEPKAGRAKTSSG
jgi:hypothetical protein